MKKFLSSTVAQMFFLEPKFQNCVVGIEIEIEAEYPIFPEKGWRLVPDGSLRGYCGEYVSDPVTVENAKEKVFNLYNKFEERKVLVKDSMRAGVHVHVNCQDLTLRQLFTFLAAYYCLEELLTEELGEERQGNLFCLRLSDAEFANNALLYVLQAKTVDHNIFNNNNLRYAAANLVSLSKFGTIEFRALKTPTSPEPIIDWVETLQELYKGSKKYNNPAELLSAMSANGENEVVRALLGPKAEKQITKADFQEKLYFGIRNIQQWVFLTDWSE
jgi:hypothetical protein